MARRATKNRTGLTRLPGEGVHDAWVSFVCISCMHINAQKLGNNLLEPEIAFEGEIWVCDACGFSHEKNASLPFDNWPKAFAKGGSIHAQRFWLGFFRMSTEHNDSYWKWCNSCGRILPFSAFSRHVGWGPLERQMECRSCKGGINAKLNPRRTAEQLHEGARRRRTAELLLGGENQRLSIDELFKRFGNKCFKTKKPLIKKDRKSWVVDHILPSAFLHPLSIENAALLSREANNQKRDRWPSDFYTNSELIELSKITGANLEMLASRTPIINANIDVNACVLRSLKVREKSVLVKRIRDLKWLLAKYNLVDKLSKENRKMLGL